MTGALTRLVGQMRAEAADMLRAIDCHYATVDKIRAWADDLEAALTDPQQEKENEPAPVCAEHDVPCEMHWICPTCINENPELDACASELENANAEITDLRHELAYRRKALRP